MPESENPITDWEEPCGGSGFVAFRFISLIREALDRYLPPLWMLGFSLLLAASGGAVALALPFKYISPSSLTFPIKTENTKQKIKTENKKQKRKNNKRKYIKENNNKDKIKNKR